LKKIEPAFEGYEKDDVEVACVTFAYDNVEVIDLLLERGSHISSGEFDKFVKAQNKITTVIDRKFEQLVRPVKAFVTFTTQEAAERCLRAYGTKLNNLYQVKF
jgi:hypothetical protein